MLIAFVLGFLIDIFYDSLGMHTAALVAVAFFRNTWLQLIAPQGGYDEGPTLAANGVQWFLVYSIPMVGLHHLLLFFIEAGGFSMIGFTLTKAFSSMALTLIVMLLLQYLVIRRRR
ncbi:MAG: Rod shape-determining protein MreD [Flammeovirgaceae bacterium]|nr:Rod shape-determining protein MreD [Flammeovirgaceae bacterium]